MQGVRTLGAQWLDGGQHGTDGRLIVRHVGHDGDLGCGNRTSVRIFSSKQSFREGPISSHRAGLFNVGDLRHDQGGLFSRQ